MRHVFHANWFLTVILITTAGCASTPSGQRKSGGPAKVIAPTEPQKLAPTPKEIAGAADAAFQAQDWPVAEGAYARLLDFEPKQARTWMRLGHCRMALRKYPEAIEAFEQVKSGPALPTARYDIACALALQGKTEAALDELDGAIEAGFSDKNALANDPDIASLRSSERYAAALAKVQSLAPKKFEPPAEARQFDFWIGEWNVVTPAGAQAGTSRIEKILGGCALLENWTSAGGSDGKSFNVYDPKKQEWRQHWIDDSGVETFYAGTFADKCMSLTSDQLDADGKQRLHRMRFFDLGAEGVRQWGEVSDDRGANWKTEFDLFYKRK